LVLWVIAYEAFWRPWRARKWVRRVYDRCFWPGILLHRSVPNNGATAGEAGQWVASFNAWFNETQTELRKHSLQSVAAFVMTPIMTMDINPAIHHDCQNHYRAITAHVSNLKDIMEKPDIYF